uniref:Maturation n=1 Tax=Leviviridae sp. TaxID=2027243 RepID=A0A514D573_9VIRU|nr:MAG: hypothetical protein H2Bulk35506_000001 [Leviviridae sp.]
MSFPRPRVRGTTDLVDGIYARGSWTSDPTFLYSFGADWKSFRRYEYITDVVGTPKTQKVKPVLHVKARYDGLPMQSFRADHGYVISFRDDAMPNIDIAWLLGLDEFSLPHSQRVIAAQEAFNSFSDRFPAKISGAEFVQGLFELSALIPKLQHTITQTIASAYLTKKFGWDNLISDLKQFTSLASSIRERMEFLKRTYGKPTKLYFKKPDIQNVESWTHDFNNGRSWTTRLTLVDYQCDFTAGATLVQQLSHIDDAIGWLRAIVISLGLNNIAVSIWKTSRLSFVVDWFFNVSGSLTRLASVQPAEKWDVYDVSSTVKLKAKFSVVQVNDDVMDAAPNPEHHLGYLTIERYERLVGLPLDLSLFTPSSATPDQLVLMAAMVGAK